MEVELNEHKKSRMDQIDAPPSKVVHIRSLPMDATEQDVTLLAIPFGHITNMVLSKRNSQALVEMELLECAIEMVAYYQQYPAILHGRQLVLQFSKHAHLELKAENVVVDQAIQTANAVVQQDLSGANQGSPNTVLRILIDNILEQQINHVIIYKIFHRFGKILRVIIFLKNHQYQGFIEFEDHVQAFVAMLHLNGQNIYTGCCHLMVEFSKNRGPLEIRHESQKCRDYVLNPLTEEEQLSLRRLPSAGMASPGGHYMSHGGHGGFGGSNSAAVAAAMSQFATAGGPGGPMVPHPHHQGASGWVPAAAAANNNACRLNEFTSQLMALASQAGLQLSPAAAAATASFMSLSSQGGASFPGANGAAISPAMASILALSAAVGNSPGGGAGGHAPGGGGGGRGGQYSSGGPGGAPGGTLQQLTAAQAAAAAAQSSGMGIRLPPNNNGSTVLIVSNLNEERVYPDALFTLFGVYGDVIRVKIMFNKKDTALVQFNDSQQALLALQYLDRKTLWGNQMKIAVSRHNYVQLPKEDKDNQLTKDYSNNLLHRFRKPNSKNFQNIYPPSHVLHLSNIPPTVAEEDVRSLFASKGFAVTGFRFMQKDNKMALVQLDSVESAMEALIALHNTQLSENSHLRISFSKSAI